MSLGDSFLCASNPVVAHVRQAALTFGFKLSRRPSSLWHNYQILPMTCLREILETRTIPYIDNVTPLRQLLEQKPGLVVSERFLLESLRRNFVIHESAHCMAAHVLSRLSERATRPTPERQVLLSLLGEAFANTTERMGATFARTQHHRLLYLLNTHLYQFNFHTVAYQLATARYGFTRTARFVCVSFLFSNLCQDHVSRTVIDRWSQRIFGTCSYLERKQHEHLFRLAFRLSREFREDTTELHFRMQGQSRPLRALRAKDPSQCADLVFEPLQLLTELLEKGPKSTHWADYAD